ncbi:T9SS-dependent choice-of-anchor J family protein [Chryseobacterium sp. 2987]|uniref:T9SS-dependent choice-of-anchor J family protein n=1 Tax=Chryseobacterium sp. 2987 TaxID=2817767 RepID=UPI0028667FA0|nr:choice-of-anchor J domain-containing protein [Chryseobacterium sp. 2987]MDR6921491.1 thiol-disulfide isomerase/thioredoxin [Chryseobacterium sp. 2987]
MKKILFMACILMFGIHQSQTYYSQNFNTGLNGWTSTDLDGDGKQWATINASNGFPSLGAGSLISYSYQNNVALTPNNLITSPLIDLSTVTASNVYLTYAQVTHAGYPEDKYSIYVTASNAAGTITASTPVYTETVAVGGLQYRSINLSSFIGQQVYLSFRHYDCTDQYYLLIDEVQIKTIPNNDFTLKNVSLNRYGLINTDYSIKATVKNNGAQSINNVTLNWNDGIADHISTIPLASPLGFEQEVTITHPVAVNFASVTEKNLNISISQVNGTSDSSPADNTLATKFTTVSQNSPKKVVIEEGTGTWCGYCPRGAVAMENATNSFPNDFIGIAVHNGDPMQVDEYDTNANFSGFPGMNVDRSLLNEGVSVSFASFINERKTLIIPAALNATTALAGQALTLNASAVFRSNFTNANFRFAAVLIENDVKGTAAGYNQVNYYAGSTTPMGGYENKPNPVPAADMVYNHVGRMLLGGYAGQAGSIPATITDGQTVNYTFTANIPTAYNISKMKAILLLIDATTGEIVNAAGPFAITGTLGVHDEKTDADDLVIYPNPSRDFIKIQTKGKVDLKIFDASGRVVLEKSGVEPDTSISVQDWVKGAYIVSVKEKGSEPITKKLIIK